MALTSLHLWVSLEHQKVGLEDYDPIGPEGAQALAGALKINKALASLNLGGNSIGDDGARELAEALKINAVLTDLNLRQNSVGPEGTRELAEALKSNKALASSIS